MQEVTGLHFSFLPVDCFEEIKQELNLKGELLFSWHLRGDPSTYCGNATFFKPSLVLKERVNHLFKPFQEIASREEIHPSVIPRNALFLCFEHEGKPFWSVNTHLAWGPTPLDEPYKVEQAKILSDHLTALKEPFILSGDFNVTPNTQVVKLINAFGHNLTAEHDVTNTLNPQLHKAKHLFPQGLAVDYIVTHPALQVKHFEVIENQNLSDHRGLVVEFLI